MGGYFALQGFAQYFVADELRVDDPVGTTALLMATMGAAIFLLAIPTGVLADRMGRRPLNLVAGVIGVLATLALVFVVNVPQLILVGGMVGVSAGVFLSVNWAWAADLVPASEAGHYLGLSNLATAGSSAFARLLSGPVVDAGNAVHLGLGFNALFVLLAVAMAVGTWILAGVPETKTVGSTPLEVPVSSEQRE
jgi:MFS family permease